MRALLLHTAPPDTVRPGRRTWELDLGPAAQAIADALPDATVARVRGEAREILALLDTHQPAVVYNLCEAPLGRPDLEAHVASLLEWAAVPFTGSGSETLALCRRKDRTAAVLAAAGVPVPATDGFPAIVKPIEEDGSAGIDRASICDDEVAVHQARARIAGRALVQRFLPGREFAVSLWGGTTPDHVSIGETLFRGDLRLITYAAKWEPDSIDFVDSPLTYDVVLDVALRDALVNTARDTWRAVEARGCLRVDIRLDDAGEPSVLDVNPNPETAPGVGIHRAVVESGWTWERFVRAQITWASF